MSAEASKSGLPLLAALALQVVHRIDRNGVATHGVDVVHGNLLKVCEFPRGVGDRRVNHHYITGMTRMSFPYML